MLAGLYTKNDTRGIKYIYIKYDIFIMVICDIAYSSIYIVYQYICGEFVENLLLYIV